MVRLVSDTQFDIHEDTGYIRRQFLEILLSGQNLSTRKVVASMKSSTVQVTVE